MEVFPLTAAMTCGFDQDLNRGIHVKLESDLGSATKLEPPVHELDDGVLKLEPVVPTLIVGTKRSVFAGE